IDGGAGNDTISCTANTDIIFGGDGDDTLSGGSGNDFLEGGAGNDIIFGNAGNDVLTGGLGIDTLTGGGGTIRVVFAESGSSNVDTITDYTTNGNNNDTIDVSELLDTNFGAGSVVADFVRLVQTGSDITVQVDTDGIGAGATWSEVVVLSNYGSAGADLVNV